MNRKRIAALAGVIALLAAVSLPMVFAFDQSENATGKFLAALGAAIFVPIMAYVIWLIARILGGKKARPQGSIRNIVFDVGQVLVSFDWETYLDSFGLEPAERETLAREVFLSQLWNERDRGLYEEEYYIQEFIKAAPQYAQDIRRAVEGNDRCLKAYDYSYTWTAYLKNQGYRLFVLSNFAKEPLEKVRPSFTFLENMDGIVFSCYEKQIKPEPDIFRTLLERYRLTPSETVFLDDREDNCKAARREGMHAICFQNLKQAAAELEKLGVA